MGGLFADNGKHGIKIDYNTTTGSEMNNTRESWTLSLLTHFIIVKGENFLDGFNLFIKMHFHLRGGTRNASDTKA